jgi:hypothetical protein
MEGEIVFVLITYVGRCPLNEVEITRKYKCNLND